MQSLEALSFKTLTSPNPASGYSLFLAACVEGNLDLVKSILSFSPGVLDTLLALKIPTLDVAGPEMANKTPYDVLLSLGTPIHLAIQKWIEEKTKGMKNISLIHLAARVGSSHHIRKLGAMGVNLNEISRNKRDEDSTPLCLAAAYNSSEVMEELICQGALINKKNCRGFSPVLFAAKKGNTKNLMYLLDKYPNLINARFCDQANLLHIAAREGRTDMVEALLNMGMDVNEENKYRYSQEEDDEIDDDSDWGSYHSYQHAEDLRDFDILTSYHATPLMLAAKGGSIATLNLLISRGALIQMKDAYDCSVLFYACNGGHLSMFKFLIKNFDLEVNCRNVFASTLLHAVTNVEIAKMLISEYGLKVNAVDNNDETPLHFTTSCGAIEVAKYLIKSGADVNAKNCHDRNPLTLALYTQKNCKPEIVSFLLDCGSSVDLVALFSKNHRSYIVEACLGQTAIVKLLIDRVSNGVNDKICGRTFLHLSSTFSLETSKFLVEYGADVNLEDDNGRLPLHVAVQEGNADIVKFLIEQGSKIYVADEDSMTPLFVAVQCMHSDIALLLLQYSNNVYVTNQDQDTVLHIAARHGLRDIAEALLDIKTFQKDASAYGKVEKDFRRSLLLKRNKLGRTALHDAVSQRDNTEMAAALIAHGSEIDFPGPEKETVVHCAVLSGDMKAVQFVIDYAPRSSLNKKNEKGETPLHAVIHSNRYWDEDTVIQLVRLLVSRGCDIHAVNTAGQTALHLAALSNWYSYTERNESSISLLKLLLELGCDSTAVDLDGKTALHLAAQKSEENCSAILEYEKECSKDGGSKQYSLHIQDAKGRTPLHAIVVRRRCRFRYGNQAETIIPLLLRYGCDIEVKDHDGKTALHLAAGRSESIVEALVNHGADVNAVDKNGNTPLHIAARKRRYGNCNLLLERGADVSKKNKKGELAKIDNISS